MCTIDDTYLKALKFCIDSKQASVSMIQRRFPLRYIEACKIIEWMENMQYVTPYENSVRRKVLLTAEEFKNIYGAIDIDEDTVDNSVNNLLKPAPSASRANYSFVNEGKIDSEYIKALKFFIVTGHPSVADIQRHFPVGYIKACKIIDWMEQNNYITHSDGSAPRKVKISMEEFIDLFGDADD